MNNLLLFIFGLITWFCIYPFYRAWRSKRELRDLENKRAEELEWFMPVAREYVRTGRNPLMFSCGYYEEAQKIARKEMEDEGANCIGRGI